MTLAVTGHRPPKIGGYSTTTPLRQWVKRQLGEQLRDPAVKRAIGGMALGVDQDFAELALTLGIPLIAAVPFEGQESQWLTAYQRYYHRLLAQAHEVVIVSSGGYSVKSMQVRNEWMVDHCDRLVAVWDGSSGGTGNCVRYAEKAGRPITRIDPRHFRWL